MSHVVIAVILGFVFAVIGGGLQGGGGAFFGFVLGLVVGAQIRLHDRLRRLEQREQETPLPARTPVPAAGPDTSAGVAEQAATVAAAVAAEPAPAPVPAPAPWPAEAPVATPAAVAPATPGPLARGIAWLKNYATSGNVVAKAGVLLLFFGVSFLLKYAIDRNALPIEVRLAGTAAAAIALIVTGWRLRSRRADFGLVLQGGGIGLLYLTVFAAARLYHVLPMGFTFLLLLALVALSAALAVLQDSRALAILGTIGGFLAPVLTSTGSGSHVALFSYYALLNAGIVAIAWFKAWRLLNVTGFVFTFVIGAAWGERYYRPEFFATTEPFLVLSFLFYLAVPVLFAARHPPRLRGYVDGTLVFGLPMVVFALQAPLVRDFEFGRAWSAFGMGAVYLALGAWLRARQIAYFAMLVEAFLALAVVALSLAIPFAFDGHITAAAWALEGAGLVWIGVRQHRALARASGTLLQFAAGAAFFLIQSFSGTRGIAVLNAEFLGSVFISLGALFASLQLVRHRQELKPWETAVPVLLLAWGLAWWYGAGFHEIGQRAPSRLEPGLSLLFLGASSAALAWSARRLDWNQAACATWLHAPLALLLALVAWADSSATGPLAAWRWAGWLATLGAAWYAAWQAEAVWKGRWLPAAHALSLWLALFLLGWGTAWTIGELVPGAASWAFASWGALGALALVLLPRYGTALAWPVARFDTLYLGQALLLPLAFTLAWTVAAVDWDGDPYPLGYLPLANPIDLVSLGGLLAALYWWRAASEDFSAEVAAWLDRWLPRTVGALGFLWLNAATARAVHVYADVDYRLHALHHSASFQGSISVLWGVTALAIMVGASRRGIRALWMCGAVLLGALVLKLFFVDLGDRGTVARIVSFIAAGGLMVLIGYLSPVPPRTTTGTAP